MIDKAEQRRRAAEMSKDLAAQGYIAPTLTYPVKPKPVNVPSKVKKPKIPMVDCAGKQLYVGDLVATTTDGVVSVLRVGKIIRFTKLRVEIEIAPHDKYGAYIALKYPQAIAKVT